jgi:hypothetical protein
LAGHFTPVVSSGETVLSEFKNRWGISHLSNAPIVSCPELSVYMAINQENNSVKYMKLAEVSMDATTSNAVHHRDIKVTAEATSIEKWRKQVIAGQPETGRSYALISDEGNYIPGGEGTAPTPLTYFVSGMAL